MLQLQLRTHLAMYLLECQQSIGERLSVGHALMIAFGSGVWAGEGSS
jgi:hypothetical protein